jgi:hypothetical protein
MLRVNQSVSHKSAAKAVESRTRLTLAITLGLAVSCLPLLVQTRGDGEGVAWSRRETLDNVGGADCRMVSLPRNSVCGAQWEN